MGVSGRGGGGISVSYCVDDVGGAVITGRVFVLWCERGACCWTTICSLSVVRSLLAAVVLAKRAPWRELAGVVL